MKQSDYLKQLQKDLKGFSAEKRADIFNEITGHFDDAVADGNVELAEAEMGSPRKLARGMKGIYRPNRWAEYLIIILPPLLVTQVVNIVGSPFISFRQQAVVHITVMTIVAFLLTLVSLRWSAEVRLFWSLQTASKGLPILLSTLGILEWDTGYSLWVGMLMSGLVLSGGAILVYTLRKNRHDFLLLSFGGLLLAEKLTSFIVQPLLFQNLSMTQFGARMHTLTMMTIPMMIVLYGLFFLFDQRALRWLALQLVVVFWLVANVYLAFGVSAPFQSTSIIIIVGATVAISAVHQVIVAAGWLAERRRLARLRYI